MPDLVELDRNTTYMDQLRADTGPIVLANTVTVDPDEVDALIEIWAAEAAFMKTQPGFESNQLHRGTAGSGTLLNVAVWETTADLRAAFTTEQFQQHMASYPDGAIVSPHVFERVAVDGICVG